MKKINFKQPKYILPLVVLLPLVFLVYNVSNIFSSDGGEDHSLVQDSINLGLPEADERSLESKLDAMDRAAWSDDTYSALYGIGQDEEDRDEASQNYSEAELAAIQRDAAERAQQAQQQAELERTLSESRRHLNNYTAPSTSTTSSYNSSSSNPARSQYDQLEDYSQALEQIQSRNRRRNNQGDYYGYDYDDAYDEYERSTPPAYGQPSTSQAPQPHPEIVHKAAANGANRFYTIGTNNAAPDAALIKAIIDKTTKARSGTRIRFKLLDDVTIKGVTLKKGVYLYGTVTGFGEQRVLATITSILINDKFVKVNLSVYDTDGMQGFYVPASTFRSFLKESGASLASSGSSAFNNNSANSGTAVSAEMMALQALQGLYSSASSAVSNNLRQDKAKIKYNTTVYLINASQDND